MKAGTSCLFAPRTKSSLGMKICPLCLWLNRGRTSGAKGAALHAPGTTWGLWWLHLWRLSVPDQGKCPQGCSCPGEDGMRQQVTADLTYPDRWKGQFWETGKSPRPSSTACPRRSEHTAARFRKHPSPLPNRNRPFLGRSWGRRGL